jgi:hypothetical protein
VTQKRADQIRPGDRVRMSIGSALVTAVEPLEDDRTMFTFLAGTKHPADNDLLVEVIEEGDPW